MVKENDFGIRIIVSILILIELVQEPALWARDIAAPPEVEEPWAVHFQVTTVTQWHPDFSARYSGPNSLSEDAELKTSLTSTLFTGVRLWEGAAVYVDPELAAGSGFSHTLGVAGFPNGEIYRVASSSPKLSLARLFFRQTFGLGGEKEHVEPDQQELAGDIDDHRITLTVGKFSLTDLFDDNAYSHNPRTQFLNWSLMDNGAWDYAADTRGYTWAVTLEYNQPRWALRGAMTMVPKEANQLEFDHHLSKAHGDNIEFEYRYAVKDHPGKLRLFWFANHAHMGSYRETIDTPAFGMDITRSRQYRVKYGGGINLEQELRADLGIFLRAGWNDGHTETWAFTEIDRTVSLGMSLKGIRWGRPEDTVGLAGVINGLSRDHADYLVAGGVGFIIGDGKLSYAPEQIIEAYYQWKLLPRIELTADTQSINHPAYNADRGPVFIAGARIHYEF